MKLSKILFELNDRKYATPWGQDPGKDSRVQKILSFVGSKKKVLDIGCYDGTIASEIIKKGNQVVGVDISPNAVRMAKKKGVQACVCNIEEENLPSSFGKFDVIVAGEIIDHIFDPDSFFQKMRSLLKPGGYLVLTTPNLAGLGSRLSLLFGRLPWMIENEVGRSGHIRYFTLSDLQRILRRNGFEITNFTTTSVGLSNFTISYLEKLFPTLGRILIVKARRT